jgi:hypothetical protein
MEEEIRCEDFLLIPAILLCKNVRISPWGPLGGAIHGITPIHTKEVSALLILE